MLLKAICLTKKEHCFLTGSTEPVVIWKLIGELLCYGGVFLHLNIIQHSSTESAYEKNPKVRMTEIKREMNGTVFIVQADWNAEQSFQLFKNSFTSLVKNWFLVWDKMI